MNPTKTTTSACPKCLRKVPAQVFERDGRVFLSKECPTHGADVALLASDASLYWNAGPEGGKGCCTSNHSCTMIFEITERCNLSCPTCFSGSSPHLNWQMSFEEFERKLDALLAKGKRDSDMVQLSGGEPTLHPDLERMVALLFERGIRKVYVNTNGIRIAKEPDLVKRLAAIDGGRDRLQFYLQFDGFEERTHALIRGAKGLSPIKRQAIANLHEHGLYALPVMAVTRGVNLDEIGAVVRMLIEHHPKMNTVILQPAFYAGRYENEQLVERLTLAEVANEVSKQTGGLFLPEDFGPIPCSHPNCFALAVAFVRDGKVIPVSRYFPKFATWKDPAIAPTIEKFTDRMPQHMIETLAEDDMIDSLLDLMGQSDESANWADYKNFVLIGIKPFMDAHTYDQDRVDRCCVHVIDREGAPVSLCEYNTLRRPRGLL
ncbi:MAG: radical SAM protein [Myxococcales bacterium]|nr:radical SAM protein [Myxococcales bacterium]